MSHALSIGITAILITGLIISGTNLLESQRDRVVEQGLEDVGSAVVSDLVQMDWFASDRSNSAAEITGTHPSRVGGTGYRIVVVPTPERTTIWLNATSDSSDISVPHRYQNQTNVCESTVDGGSVTVEYNTSNDCIELRDG